MGRCGRGRGREEGRVVPAVCLSWPIAVGVSLQGPS